MLVLGTILIIVFLPEIISGIVVGALGLFQVIGGLIGAMFSVFK